MLLEKIKPNDLVVDSSWELMSSKWQNRETESGAFILLKFAQQTNLWTPFTKKELDAFANEEFWFNYLRKDKWG